MKKEQQRKEKQKRSDRKTLKQVLMLVTGTAIGSVAGFD